MKIQMKIKFKNLFFIIFISLSYTEDLNLSLNLALKDSLIDISKVNTKFQNQPEYMFLNALIDSDGESAKNKFRNFKINTPYINMQIMQYLKLDHIIIQKDIMSNLLNGIKKSQYITKTQNY